LSNEDKTNDYENFEKGMISMKILKKGRVVEKRGEEETKFMPHAPVFSMTIFFKKSRSHMEEFLVISIYEFQPQRSYVVQASILNLFLLSGG
jgi:hypothetical protein